MDSIALEIAACVSKPDIPSEEARQMIWRAFAEAVRSHNADACYSILDLHRAYAHIMTLLS